MLGAQGTGHRVGGRGKRAGGAVGGHLIVTFLLQDSSLRNGRAKSIGH